MTATARRRCKPLHRENSDDLFRFRQQLLYLRSFLRSEQDVDAAIYTLAGQDGFEWQFNDFDAVEAPRMQRRVTTPGGGQLDVVAYNGNRIAAVELNLVQRETKAFYHFKFQVCIPSPNPCNEAKVFSVLARQEAINLCDTEDTIDVTNEFLAKSLKSFIGQWKHDNEANNSQLPSNTDK